MINMENMLKEKNYCRKCQKILPQKDFYEAVDCGFVDTNGYMSICKKCIQNMYDEIFKNTQSMEKTIHKLCVSLNIEYSNDAVSAMRDHINTLLENGKKVHSFFGIYKMKLVAVKKSMDKSKKVDQTYKDIGTIYIKSPIDTTKVPIPDEVRQFWGEDLTDDAIRYLEGQYVNFKQNHQADTYAKKVLLREVCFILSDIKQLRSDEDASINDIKNLEYTLQNLLGELAITPKGISKTLEKDTGQESFGLWIRDIEKSEPAQWLSTDPRGDMYRDVGNVESYFEKFFVRPMKNFIMNSKDFNIEDTDDFSDNDEFVSEYDEDISFTGIDEDKNNGE